MTAALNLVIGIATAGRREQMSRTLAQIERQVRPADAVVVCPAASDDFDVGSAPQGLPLRVVPGPRGLTSQRNAIMAACPRADAIVFLDDDFYPAPDYLFHVEQLLRQHPDVVIATSHPELDGATGPGVEHQAALAELASMERSPPTSEATRETYGGYGCNMVVRLEPARVHGVRFDENLPLYGWLEDIDFSRRMAPHGRIVCGAGLRGVHLGTKAGRTSGLRLGYSQVANPLYLWRNRSLTARYALRHIAKNVLRNVQRSLWPEAWVDRRGRLKGNLVALRDLCRGNLHPKRVLTM